MARESARGSIEENAFIESIRARAASALYQARGRTATTASATRRFSPGATARSRRRPRGSISPKRCCFDVKRRGVTVVPVTLHVGPGTFRPLANETVEENTARAGVRARQEGQLGRDQGRPPLGEKARRGRHDDDARPRDRSPGGPLANQEERVIEGETYLSGTTDLFIYPGLPVQDRRRAPHESPSARNRACFSSSPRSRDGRRCSRRTGGRSGGSSGSTATGT